MYSYLPFMILPLYGNLSKMDLRLLEAAADLGASPYPAHAGLDVLATEAMLQAPEPGDLVAVLPIANHDNTQHAENENLRLANLWFGIDALAGVMAMDEDISVQDVAIPWQMCIYVESLTVGLLPDGAPSEAYSAKLRNQVTR